MSKITTHVLDTSIGKPAAGIKVSLFRQSEQGPTPLASGVTNSDGRISDLLDSDHQLEPGEYLLEFGTGEYFQSRSIQSFYPQVVINFFIPDHEHYHVPLLLNPYGYSTYRGS